METSPGRRGEDGASLGHVGVYGVPGEEDPLHHLRPAPPADHWPHQVGGNAATQSSTLFG